MGRAPWLEEFASRWATRWVESQLPSWLGAALRQTSIGFELRSMRFMLHRASVDDTSMTCCSCTPARPCLCEALTPRIAARCTTVTISLAQMDPVVHSASFATCVISLCDYQSCVHSTMFLVPNACNQLKGRTKGKGKGAGKILFTIVTFGAEHCAASISEQERAWRNQVTWEPVPRRISQSQSQS